MGNSMKIGAKLKQNKCVFVHCKLVALLQTISSVFGENMCIQLQFIFVILVELIQYDCLSTRRR